MKNPLTLRRDNCASRIPALLLLSCLALAGLVGCSTPIGAKKVTLRQAYKQLNENALVGSEVSADTKRVVHRYDLERQLRKDPVAALTALHNQATNDSRRDVLFALAELSYQHAERLRHSVKPGLPRQAPNFYLSSAIYAYLFLLGDGPEPPPGAFDRRLRLACDFYNRALAQALLVGPASNAAVQPIGGLRTLLPGTVDIQSVHPEFKWSLEEVEKFLPADEFAVRGLTVRDRQSGLGAPLIAVGKTLDQKRFPRRFPVTVFLRVQGDVKAWSAGQMTGSLELYSSYEQDSTQVSGKPLPLEADMTAPLAYGLNDAWIWKLGAAQFFSAEERIKSGTYLSQPYEPGLVPVVFVHGTFSSPVWWAEMWNTLRADPVLRKHYQFWNFIYNSGNPISLSATKFREALSQKVEQLDPEGKDPALRRMVIIGHSQGGLLTKLTATDTGDKLWRTVSAKPLEDLNVSAEVRQALRTNFFFTRLPCVERVVFVSTPHRGSFLATDFVRNLSRLFMSLPQTILFSPANMLQLRKQIDLPPEVRDAVPTSLDGMSPKNPWLLALAEIPPAPGVTAHSIVAIKGNDQPPSGSDGVVKYTSAHVPYVESEFIVRSGHSCQEKPPTIEEVRRILLEHIAAGSGGKPVN